MELVIVVLINDFQKPIKF